MSSRVASDEVQAVTAAGIARSADRQARTRVYLLQMGLRVVCLVAAFFAHGGWQVALFVAAVVLPYVAVVSVNATGPQAPGALPPVPPDTPRALPAEATGRTADHGPVVVEGDAVDEDAAAHRALPAPHPGHRR
ncbi:DUF3099 domain-containing protein [Micrococcus sp.]|uniref:DUF3099 domain-containing protein n=1 Tax=Micrococcus sp. TaxID=1271 RepID=UPI002A916A92|nr:DUF3099 domain-containing protein [Micrococcus sp.]MDY6054283.1 DUF3099 domain-containing protein [Micrococcus sp.]